MNVDAGVIGGDGGHGAADAGRALDSGVVSAWARDVPLDTWHPLIGTQFLDWANQGGIPAGAYRGTSPFASIVDAFCDPAFDGRAQYFFGGGHGDGSCNAVIKFDHATLAWSLVGQPTPPSTYLPGYLRSPGDPGNSPPPLRYPSGLQTSGWFLSAEQDSDPRDAAFLAPELARVSTHMYAAAAKRGSMIHYFYLTYGEFDVATGRWNPASREVNLGAQLLTFRPQYGDVPLQQGTVAVYDEVTDRFFVTLNPGDSGGGWRSGILAFDPKTRKIEEVYESDPTGFGLILNSINICRVNRDLYCFLKPGINGTPQPMNSGFIFNMDTRAMKAFRVEGSTDGTTYLDGNPSVETIPSYFDGIAIRRWNFDSAHAAQIHSIQLVPLRGSGALADPFILNQTVRTLTGLPPDATQVYSRLVWSAVAGCALVLPRASANWVAIKLST